MRLAELARVRWVLAAASIAFIGSGAAVLATHRCHHHHGSKPAVVQRHELPVIGGCHERRRHREPVVVPVEQPKTTGDKYGDALLAIRPALDACLKKSSKEVTYRLSVDIGTNGSVLAVDVRSEAKDMRKVSLKTTQCLERAVGSATFPVSNAPTFARVSTVLKP